MKVVIVWDRNRESAADLTLVHSILDQCKEQYSKVRIIIKGTDRGIGKSIKTRLTDPTTKRPNEMDWTEVSLTHHLVSGELPKLEFTADYDALNSVLVELGDEFHILTEDRPRGVTMNLLRRVIEAHRSYALYKQNELTPKKAAFHEDQNGKETWRT